MSKKTKKTLNNQRNKFKYEFLSNLHRKSEVAFEVMQGLGVLDYDMIPMFNSHIVFENGYHMSIQSGKHCYSTPRKNLPDIRDYTAFEVVCFDMRENWLAVRLKKWRSSWTQKYDGSGLPAELYNIKEGHMKSTGACIMPFLPVKDVELLYQYLKRQKRKFVITEKYKQEQYEEQN